MISPGALLTRLRRRRPFLDHLVRMYGRYQADTGDRLAAAVTFYWFLSLFPILLLAVSLLGYVLKDPQAQVNDALAGILPKQLTDTLASVLQNSKGKAGAIGLVGLLFSGLGWVDGLREAIRTIWHQNVQAGNIVTRKIFDTFVLLGLLATIAASLLVTGLVNQATGEVVRLLGLSDTPAVQWLLKRLSFVVTGAADTALFLYLLTRLARVRSPLRRVFSGALFGAFGFEVLKWAGAYYVARTTTKGQATYGTFAVVVGLLLFLNLVSRLILYTAAFTVTAPYDSDVAPSGTADAEQARKAGIPVEYADNDPDDPPLLLDQGAPTPLRAAVQGRTPPQDEPEGRPAASAPAARAAQQQPVGAPAAVATLPRSAEVQLAARATAGLLGLGALAVGAYALHAVRDLVRH